MADRYTASVLFHREVSRAVEKAVALEKIKVYAVCCGSGGGLQRYLSSVPGSGGFLVGCSFPYATSETDRFLGFKPPDGYVSRSTAIHLAMQSYIKAAEHLISQKRSGKETEKSPVGIGVTAAVATSRPLRGGYRAHLSVVTKNNVQACEYVLEDGVGLAAREMHSATCDIMALDSILATLGMQQFGTPLALANVPQQEQRDLLFSRPLFTSWGGREEFTAKGGENIVFLSGSFNPLHDGHRNMAAAVEKATGRKVIYNTTADSVHKNWLTVTEMLTRAAQVRVDHWNGHPYPILFTQNDPLFVDKIRLFPGANFAVGADTVARMLEPVWYPDGELGVQRMLDELRDGGAHFFVFGRQIGDRFMTMMDIRMHHSLLSMFTPIDGRWDISSTEIRNGERR